MEDNTYEFIIRVIGHGRTPQESWGGLLDEGMFYFPDGDYSMPEEWRILED